MSDSDFLWGLTYFLALFAAVLALPTTWFLLRRYRKSIIRLMGQRAAMAEPPLEPDSPSSDSPVPASPRIPVRLDPDLVSAGIRRNLVVVVVVGLLSAFALAVLFLVWNDIAISIYRLAFFTVLDSWPIVLGVSILTGGNRRSVLWSIAIYFVALFTAGLIGGGGVGEIAQLWAWTLIPTAAIIAFLSRRLRGVGPLVLVAMMVAIVGAQFFATTVVGSETLLGIWVDLFFGMGITDASIMFFGLQATGFVGSLIIGILITRAQAGWYARQGFSDQMLLLGATLMVFTIDYAVGVSPSNAGAFGAGVTIYVVVLALALFVYRLIHRRGQPSAALLMLRVFSPHPENQRLLDRINARWRYLGPVRMIGGPDLAVTNVEPDEFLAFISGRLRRLFIDGPEMLEERLQTLRVRTDPDARYRIDEFFCFDDTWRETVTRLLESSDAVVMDLRDFGPDNQGCIHEIELLVTLQALTRSVFLVDEGTDRELLDSVLGTPKGGRPTLIKTVDDDPEEVVAALLEGAALAGATTASTGLDLGGSR